MARRVVGPFNRVEGDLEVRLDVAEGAVRSAEVVSPMYRGFEAMLAGRDPMDALVIVPRICGICSVSQSLAAARALADAAGVEPPPNGRHALNLMAAIENAADHLTHFHLFFMPDFARPAYAGRPWHAEALRRHAAEGGGEHARAALAARMRWFELMGWLGGRWPHTHSLLPGGSSRPVEAAERLRLLARVREFRAFVERQLLADALEPVLALRDEDALQAWAEPRRHADLPFFLQVAADTGLAALGRGPGRCLSVGSFPGEAGGMTWPGGVWTAAGLQPPRMDRLTEDATHAWLADGSAPRHPRQGLTVPDADKPGAYTWNKAPRLDGAVAETGAVARQLAAGQPLVTDLARRHGVTVLVRVVARLLELVQLVQLAEAWVQQLAPREPFVRPHTLPEQGEGCGLNEAARGALGHWLRIEGGRIALYQIVAPTSWNFSPRDRDGTPGPLEQALVGTPVADGEPTPVAVQHVVRSFDPCMVCTVH